MYLESKLNKTFTVLVLFVLIIFIGFHKVTFLEILLWDESRLAVNAFEMYNNGHYITTYFDGSPDMWNTKPPLMIWLIVLSMKIFGVNEFAVRFPTIIALMSISLGVFYFVKKKTNSLVSAFFSSLVLITTAGLLRVHVFRTGDYDSLLVLWVTFFSFSYFEYLETKKIKYLNGFFLFLVLACYTKGIAACVPLPALALYTLFQKDFQILKERRFYFLALASGFVVLSYYLIRENQNPGYINAVFENELGGRFLKTLENHEHPWDFYLDLFTNSHFSFWIYFLPLIILFLIFNRNKALNRFVYFCLLCALVIMMILSSSKTKMDWYSAPIFPFLAVSLGISIEFFLNKLVDFLINKDLNLNKPTRHFLIKLMVVGLVISPVYHILREIKKEEMRHLRGSVQFKEPLAAVKKLNLGKGEQFKVYSDYNGTLNFYLKKFNNEQNTFFYPCHLEQDMVVGDTILSFKYLNEGFEEGFDYNVLLDSANVRVLVLNERRFNFPLRKLDYIFLHNVNHIKNSSEMMKGEIKKMRENNASIMTEVICDAGYLLELNGLAPQNVILELVDKYKAENEKGNLLFCAPNVLDLAKNYQYFDFPLTEKDFSFLARLDQIKNSPSILKSSKDRAVQNGNSMMVQIISDAGKLMEESKEATREEVIGLVTKYIEEYKKGKLL